MKSAYIRRKRVCCEDMMINITISKLAFNIYIEDIDINSLIFKEILSMPTPKKVLRYRFLED